MERCVLPANMCNESPNPGKKGMACPPDILFFAVYSGRRPAPFSILCLLYSPEGSHGKFSFSVRLVYAYDG